MDKTFTPENFEKEIYKNWLEKKYFSSKPVKGKKKFSMSMPPPNVTGKAHVGHALNNTLQDIIARTKRMQGFETMWLPGTDHAAIATEAKVVEALAKEGLSKDIIGREAFLKRGWDWYNLYGNTICNQFKELGISCDWDRLAFTMDENLNKAVRHTFVEYFNEGYIYKGTRVVNYCPHCKSSISDIENVYKEQNTNLWHLRYRLEDGSGEIIVATTRPETLFGDTAVAVNPNDERYKNIIGKNVILPLVGRKIPVIADEYCEIEFGTGAVKITPAHDPNDYEVGLRHNLNVVTCIDDNGILNENAGDFKGLDRIKARKVIEEALEKEGNLVKVEKYKNKVGCCERCGTMTEPKISEQWFVKMKELAKPAIEAVKNGELKFIPKKYEKIYLNWLENIQDWCISRQLWLGHRIPVFYCEDCGNVMSSEDEIKTCTKCGGNHIHQDPDVLDTWFSSALWPFSTLGYPEKTEDLDYFYPNDILVTAYDIIIFWVIRMVFSGLHFTGKLPFSKVLINGIVRDSKGLKMSKNLGNGINPLDVIAEYGADSLRLSLVNGTSLGIDIRYGVDKAKESKIFINKLYNASKFVISNLEGIEIKEISSLDLKEKDKWILSQLESLIKSYNKNFEKYNLGLNSANLIDFTITKFCDWYIEMAKLDLYGNDAERKNITQNILLYVLTNILKLFHPYIPFVTEYIYLELPNHDESIMISQFPSYNEKYDYKNDFEQVINLIRNIRNTRANFHVPDNKRTSIFVQTNLSIIEENLEIINKLAGGNNISKVNDEIDEKSIKIIDNNATVFIPLGELVDNAKEIERLNKEIEKVNFEISRSEKMLANPGFVSKAPQTLIDAEKAKLEKNKELLAKFENELNGLK